MPDTRSQRNDADGNYRGSADLWARQTSVLLLRVSKIGRRPIRSTKISETKTAASPATSR